MTNYSRSVLLSNGFPYSKIWLKKFDFSPIDTPANIAQKLPSQRCFKPLLIPIFNFPHNAPRLLSQAKWVHTRLSEKDRTQGHTQRNRGRFGWGGYHYPRSVLRGSETLRGRVSERRTLPLLGLGRGCAPEECREPAGQRCAHARRCPEASRPRRAAQTDTAR